jgi:hypothetical protein
MLADEHAAMSGDEGELLLLDDGLASSVGLTREASRGGGNSLPQEAEPELPAPQEEPGVSSPMVQHPEQALAYLFTERSSLLVATLDRLQTRLAGAEVDLAESQECCSALASR